MMCDARLFSPQIAAFSAHRAVMTVPMVGGDTISALAAEILAHAPAKFAMVGLSMGGIVAMEVLRQAPDRIERIAFLDTNPLAEVEGVKARRIPQMEKVKRGGLAQVMRDEMKPHYLSNTPHRAQILDLCMEMAQKLGPDVFLSQSHALMTRPDQSDTLRAASLPTLVLCGRDDALCPVARHEFMADLVANAHLEIIEGAGHLPTLEQPELTNAALARWLEA
jgi:pimeloyl-ACP methyl ester carboxylesterase